MDLFIQKMLANIPFSASIQAFLFSSYLGCIKYVLCMAEDNQNHTLGILLPRPSPICWFRTQDPGAHRLATGRDTPYTERFTLPSPSPSCQEQLRSCQAFPRTLGVQGGRRQCPGFAGSSMPQRYVGHRQSKENHSLGTARLPPRRWPR